MIGLKVWEKWLYLSTVVTVAMYWVLFTFEPQGVIGATTAISLVLLSMYVLCGWLAHIACMIKYMYSNPSRFPRWVSWWFTNDR